jgi:hypothetical protein
MNENRGSPPSHDARTTIGEEGERHDRRGVFYLEPPPSHAVTGRTKSGVLHPGFLTALLSFN